MPRPRLPQNVAKVTGAAAKNAGRFADRSSPKVAALGSAPSGFDDLHKAAWKAFADEMPWLGKSDRTVLQIACRLRVGMETDPKFPMAGFAQLRMCLSAMGGTPADRTKVAVPDDDDEDPADKFFQ